jgi:acyl transferase domain-containing protein
LIKAVLILENELIPPQIKLTSPAIHISENGLQVALQATALPFDRARRISVNSFGIGGSNAHAIVEKWNCKEHEAPKKSFAGSRMLLFSGGTETSVHASIQAHSSYLRDQPHQLDELAYTLACRREKHSYRAFATLPSGAASFATSTVVETPQHPLKVIMVFSGQGAQWPGMLQELLCTDADVLADMRAMDAVLHGLPHAPPWHVLGPYSIGSTKAEC